MPLVFAPPFLPPAPPPVDRGTLSSTWTSWDGTVWDLRDWRRGVTLMHEGVVGLHNPRIEKPRSESSSVPGHIARGWRVTGRDVFWPLHVFGDGSEAWRAVYDAFFASIRPDRAGVWTVTAGTSVRSLRLTGVFDEEHSFASDPYEAGWSVIPVNLEPEQPYWEGKLVEAGPFKTSEPVDFIPPEGAPVFHISESSTFVNASITNPGDVEAWLRWTVVGPFSAVELGAAGVIATVPFDLLEGQVLRIDTDPRNVTATLNGVDVTADLGLVEFEPVPGGGPVPLSIVAVGAGTVKAELTPLYFRAF